MMLCNGCGAEWDSAKFNHECARNVPKPEISNSEPDDGEQFMKMGEFLLALSNAFPGTGSTTHRGAYLDHKDMDEIHELAEWFAGRKSEACK
jgi:hypothetical protein